MPSLPRTCILGHDPEPTWTLRPALVGSGVVIDQVHFDQQCRRGMHQARIEWRRILGDVAAQPTAMTLTDWLLANGATIESPPEGPVVTPDAAEIQRLTVAVSGSRAQRRAARPKRKT